jgi:hypothetical protein
MPKSRGRKKKPKPTPMNAGGLKMRSMPSFTPEQHAAFRQATLAMSKQQAAAFPEAVGKVDALLRKVYPPQLLAVVSNYGLQGFVTEKGVIAPKLGKSEFSQHHVELFQAMALRIPRAEWGHEILTSSTVEPAVEALIDAADAFAKQRLSLLEGADAAKQLVLQLQERLRLHTQVVRNWGSYLQVVDHAKRLYAPLDAKLKAATGMSASELITLFQKLVSRLEDLSSERTTILGKALDKSLSRDRMIEKWFELNPDFKGTAKDVIAALPTHATRNNVMALIFAHSDLQLQSFYEFTAKDAAEVTGCKEADAARALDQLTFTPGELAARPVDHIFLDNPVWSSPLFPAALGGYFTALPHAFFSHVHRIFAKLCSAAGLEEALADRRSAFLEEELHKTVSAAFPNAKVVSNLEWRWGEQNGETDTIALIDGTLIIFEAKSGAISDPALRGAPDRAKRHVQELIGEPSIQSSRFQKLIEAGQAGDEAAQRALTELKLWPIKVDRFVRVSITLEDFTVLSSAEADLKQAGWLDGAIDRAPVMTLADFEVVADILGSEAHLVNYLWERARLQNRFDVFADELDWLGFYLHTAFAIAGTEKTDLSGLVLTGLSQSIDDYTNAKEHGREIAKFKVMLAPLWRGMLNEIAKRRFPGWIDASIALIRCASPEEQRKIEHEFQKIVRRVSPTWKKPGGKNAVHIVPIYDQPDSVVLFAYPSLNLEGQRQEARIFAQQSFAASNATRCLAIGFNADKPHAPFEYLAFVQRT